MHRNTISPRLRIHAAVAASFAIATAAFANTWTNTLGGVFSDGGNWKEGAAPTSGVAADFSKAPGEYTVRFTGDAEAGAVTFDGNQSVTLDVGAGNTWTIPANATHYFTIGDGASSSDAETSVSVVSGVITGAYKVLTANRMVKSVHLTVANPGTVLASHRDDLNIGWGGPNSTVVVKDGATLRGGRSALFGQDAAASNNFALVTGAGSWFGNGSTSGNSGLIVGWRSQDNTLIAEKGGFIHCEQNNFILGNDTAASNNTVIVRDGSGMEATMQLFLGNLGDANTMQISNCSTGLINSQTLVGSYSSGNRLEITDGSLFIPGTHLYVGNDAKACSNTVRIAGTGTIVTNKNYDFNCGRHGSYNTWIVEDGAYIRAIRSFITGTDGQSSHNRTRISGAGTLVETRDNNLVAGQSGVDNIVSVTDGARANITGALLVGFNAGACSNLLLIADGAVVTNNANIAVGNNATAADNALVISNATVYSKSVVNIGNNGPRSRLEVVSGGKLRTGHHFYFGGPVGSSNTVVLVSGEGSRLDNYYDIDVGNNARGCRMDIEDGAYVNDNRDFYVGRNSTASNNLLRVSNASLNATYDNNRVLRVNYGGTLLIEGTNTAVNVSQLQLQGESTLAFTVGRGGYMAAPITTRRPTYEAGTKLVIDATEFAKAGGGWVDLMTYIAKTGTATGDMTLLPEGIQVEETDTSLRIKVPNLLGSIIFFK